MNIPVKYNIGDTVYYADHYYEYIPAGPFIITGIDIKVNKEGTRVIYAVEREDDCDIVSERLCFDTYAECTKWCKEHS